MRMSYRKMNCSGACFSELGFVKVGVKTDQILVESLLNPRVEGEAKS